MKTLSFELNKRKDNANVKKHGISSEDARRAFYDEHALQFFDPEHSEDKERFILLGTNYKLKTLVACHFFMETETVIRIIFAVSADKDEHDAYWSQRK